MDIPQSNEPSEDSVDDDIEDATSSDLEDVLDDARKFMTLCKELNSDNNKAALNDLRFLSGGVNQWDDADAAQRTLDGRPMITVNKLPTFLHQVTNNLRQNKSSIKVHPASDGANVDIAKVRQGIIRHIEYDSNSDVSYATAACSAAGIGFGYWRLITDYCSQDSFYQDIRFKRIRNPFTVHFDPLSENPDGSDAKRVLIESRMTRAEFKRQWPKAEANDTALALGDSDLATNWMFTDEVVIAEFYRVEETPAVICLLQDGSVKYKDEIPAAEVPVKERDTFKRKVMLYKVTGCDKLEETEIMCFWIPVFPVYGDELDIDGKVIRSGLIRHSKDSLKMYNYWMYLSLDTPVPTVSGWSTVGALRVGDKIFADNGSVTNVIGKSNVAIGKECFSVEFDDGSKVTASGDHPWTVQERGKRKTKGYDWTEKTLRTDELNPSQHAIKVCGSLDLPDADLPIDPYFLGLWLGDGTSAAPTVTCGDKDASEVMSTLSNRGLNVGMLRKYGDKAGVFTVFDMVGRLRELGVLNAKHIPVMYLRASKSQRIELLQGFMDSDGSISKANHQCSFTGANVMLVQNVRELLHSLGVKTGITSRVGRVSKMANGQSIVSGYSEQLMFAAPDFPIFKLERKISVQMAERKKHTRRTTQRKIVKVERVPSVSVQCIAIDAPSHLYLCGNSMIPTHNTCATEEVALRPKTPYIGAVGQFEGFEADWAQANRKSFPFMQYNPVTVEGNLAPAPQRQPMVDIPSGMLQMAMHANDNIKATTGLFDSSLGARGNATSGKQELAQQHQGDISNFHFLDGLQVSIRHCGRCINWMIPHYYDTQRVVKIMGDDDTVSSVTINQPNPMSPMGDGAIAEVLNDMTGGEYTVTVESGPPYQTLRQEAAELFSDMAHNNQQLMQVAGDLIIGEMDIPGADKIAARIRKSIPPQLTDGENEGDKTSVDAKLQQIGQMKQQIDQQSQQMQEHGQMLQEQEAKVKEEMLKLREAQAQLDVEKAQIDAQIRIEKADSGKMIAEFKLAQSQGGQEADPYAIEAAKQEFEKWKVELQEATKVTVAAITAKTTMGTALMNAEQASMQKVAEVESNGNGNIHEIHQATLDAITGLTQQMAKPKTVIRGPDGSVQGIQ